MRLRAEAVCHVPCELGESPLWDDREGVLRWIDGPAGIVHSWSPGADAVRTDGLGQPVAAIGLCSSGELLVAYHHGIAVLGPDGERLAFAPPHADRLNDGAADRHGAYWIGSVSEDRAGHLYRLLPSGEMIVALTGIGMSNGIDWSPAGDVMYYVDTRSQRIDRLAVDPASGHAGAPRPFVTIPREVGLPDGLTVDEEGGVWLAIWGAGEVRRYRPDGSLDAVVEVPAPKTTSCAFGGADLRTLYVTSAHDTLFAATTPVRGSPPHRFADYHPAT